MRRFTVITVALASTVAFLVGLILAGQFTPTPVVTSAPRLALPLPDVPRPASIAAGAASFADVAERINASVVNIDATSNRTAIRDSQRFFRRSPEEVPRDFEAP